MRDRGVFENNVENGGVEILSAIIRRWGNLVTQKLCENIIKLIS